MRSIPEISLALRRAMEVSSMTQQSLRTAAGVSRQTLVNVLKGTEDFKVSTLLALADRLGLEVLIVPKGAARGLQAPLAAPAVETVIDRVRKRLMQDVGNASGIGGKR
jgi:transcriptional regulator with XRE-family HTH domain